MIRKILTFISNALACQFFFKFYWLDPDVTKLKARKDKNISSQMYKKGFYVGLVIILNNYKILVFIDFCCSYINCGWRNCKSNCNAHHNPRSNHDCRNLMDFGRGQDDECDKGVGDGNQDGDFPAKLLENKPSNQSENDCAQRRSTCWKTWIWRVIRQDILLLNLTVRQVSTHIFDHFWSHVNSTLHLLLF